MLPNSRHDITGSSGPLRPICEPGVRAYAQGFGVEGRCCKLVVEIVGLRVYVSCIPAH